MLGGKELSGLFDDRGLSKAPAKGETDSATELIKKSKFVPKIDLSKQVKIHRRRKNTTVRKVSKTSNSVLFQSDSEDESDEEIAKELEKQKSLGTSAFKDGARASSKAVSMAEVKQQQKVEEKVEEDMATERRRRLLMQRRRNKSDSSDDSSDDEASLAARQARIKQKLEKQKLAKQPDTTITPATKENSNVTTAKPKVVTEPPAPTPTPTPVAAEKKAAASSESESDSGDSSGSDSDSSSVGSEESTKLKFIPRSQRHTITTLEAEEALQAKREEIENEKREAIAEQTRNIVAEQVETRKVKMIEKLKRDDEAFTFARTGMPDDTDGVDEEAEYNAWKEREILRLKRDLEEQHSAALDKMETERRRNLTEEERLKEDAELIKQGKKKGEKEKGQMQFMQKYYHKGAFYMDDDSIKKTSGSGKVDPRIKDYTEAVERDRANVDLLPSVMQRRGQDFGKRGGTKWTHLTNEDTSNFKDSLWAEGERDRKKKGK